MSETQLEATNKSPTDIELGRYVREERKKQHLTQGEVAAMVREHGGKYGHFHENSVSNLENGRPVKNNTATMILKVLGLGPLAKERVYIGQTALARTLVTQWFSAASDDPAAQAHAMRLLVEFIEQNPHGGSNSASKVPDPAVTFS